MIHFLIIFMIVLLVWISLQKSFRESYIPSHPIIKEKSLNILTYNIQKFPYSLKTFEKIHLLIKKHSIILLQECYDEVFILLETYFPNYYICRGILNGLNIVNSGLVIMSIFPIITHHFTPYKHYNPLTFDTFAEKGYLSVFISYQNTILCIINTHLQSCDYERFDLYAFLQMNQLLEYTKKIKQSYIIGGDFNIDITDMKRKYDSIHLYYPKNPTIYIDFKTSHSKSKKDKGYEGLIFDYFITNKNISLYPITIDNDSYSDHNPVSSKIKLII